LLLILEGHLYKSETSSSHGEFVSHYNLIGHGAELRKVLVEIRFYINKLK
jgi:hypothetical protein